MREIVYNCGSQCGAYGKQLSVSKRITSFLTSIEKERWRWTKGEKSRKGSANALRYRGVN